MARKQSNNEAQRSRNRALQRRINPTEYLRLLYEKFGCPGLTNFTLSELDDVHYQFGAFALADHDGRVMLIRRKSIEKQPGIENYWWLPGGAQEGDETLDQTVLREFREETGLEVRLQHILLAQVARDRPFVATFFRGTVSDVTMSAGGDPAGMTAEVTGFHPGTVPFGRLWTDADKVLLVQEGFATGPIQDILLKNGLKRQHNPRATS